MSEDRDDNTRSVNRNTSAFNLLNNAINGLGAVVGAVVQGAPTRISPLIDNDVIPGMKSMANAMKFAEGYIAVWQGLTRSGVHFNNEIDQMIISVGQANITMEQFANIVKENGQEFAGMGGTIQSGVNLFLTRQAAFMSETDEEYKQLRANLNTLGYTSETLSDTFAAFDTLTTIQGMSSRYTDRERNRAAAEYAETLDELARLTGKQTDALAEEQAEISRQGNVFAFGSQLQKDVRQTLDTGLLALSQVSPEVRDYAIDMITRGFPNMDDPEMRALNAAAPQLTQVLAEARQAFLDGDRTRAQNLMNAALAEASQLRSNGFLVRQAMLGSATDISQGAMNIMGNLSRGIALNGDMIRQAAEQVARENGQVFTGSAEQLDAGLQKIIEQERNVQTARESDAQKLLETYMGGIRSLQSTAMRAQEAAVRGIFAMVTTAAAEFVDWVSGQDGDTALDAFLNSIEGPLGDVVRAIQGAAPNETRGATTVAMSRDVSGMAGQLLERLGTAGEDTGPLREAIDALNTKTRQLDRDRTNETLINEVSQLQRQLRQIFSLSGVDFSVEGSTLPSMNADERAAFDEAMAALAESGRMTGSLGEAGRLFENFGRGTLMKLHGLESVTTPDQMAAIVQQSALGGITAMTAALDGTFTNNTNMLDGMLNTIRNMPSEIANASPDANNNEELRTLITDLASQMREPLETAMNNTLVPKLEQLVVVNTESATTSNKIRKGIIGLNSDIMRSV